MGHQNVAFLAGWAELLERERQQLRGDLSGITSLYWDCNRMADSGSKDIKINPDGTMNTKPFDWDAHKRTRNMRTAQTVYHRSDDDMRKDRLKREKDEANSEAVGRSFSRSAPHKPTMHERLMPYRHKA